MDDHHRIQDEPGTVPVAIFTARAVALGELYGRMEQGYRRLSVKQRDHYGSSYGTVHIRQLPGGVSAGTAPIQVKETVDIPDTRRPDAGAPVFGHLPV